MWSRTELTATMPRSNGAVHWPVDARPLLTVTATREEVVVRPAVLRAIAVSECDPSTTVVVSHEIEYGDVVTSAPRLTPSSWNWTPATPPASDAAALTATLPTTFVPATGDVSETVGGGVGGGTGAAPAGLNVAIIANQVPAFCVNVAATLPAADSIRYSSRSPFTSDNGVKPAPADATLKTNP